MSARGRVIAALLLAAFLLTGCATNNGSASTTQTQTTQTVTATLAGIGACGAYTQKNHDAAAILARLDAADAALAKGVGYDDLKILLFHSVTNPQDQLYFAAGLALVEPYVKDRKAVLVSGSQPAVLIKALMDWVSERRIGNDHADGHTMAWLPILTIGLDGDGMLIGAGYQEGGRLAQAWFAFRNFVLLLPYKYSQSRWNVRGLLLNARWRLGDQKAFFWARVWHRFPRLSAFYARFLIGLPGWHRSRFLRKRVTITCDGVDVTRDCVAFNLSAGLVRCYVNSEDRRRITGRPARVVACVCSKCDQEPPGYAKRFKGMDRHSAHQVRMSRPKGMPRCPWCGGRWTIGALRIERAGAVAVTIIERPATR